MAKTGEDYNILSPSAQVSIRFLNRKIKKICETNNIEGAGVYIQGVLSFLCADLIDSVYNSFSNVNVATIKRLNVVDPDMYRALSIKKIPINRKCSAFKFPVQSEANIDLDKATINFISCLLLNKFNTIIKYVAKNHMEISGRSIQIAVQNDDTLSPEIKRYAILSGTKILMRVVSNAPDENEPPELWN